MVVVVRSSGRRREKTMRSDQNRPSDCGIAPGDPDELEELKWEDQQKEVRIGEQDLRS